MAILHVGWAATSVSETLHKNEVFESRLSGKVGMNVNRVQLMRTLVEESGGSEVTVDSGPATCSCECLAW